MKMLAAVLLLCSGCSRSPEDLREWRPSDHHHNTQTAEQQTPAVEPSARANELMGLDDVTIVTWRRSCLSCHGAFGRGDGPQGAAVKARDLTDPAWQASVSDEELKRSIVAGKGQMPGFQLPPTTVDGLVRLVRLMSTRGAASSNSAQTTEQTQPASSTMPPTAPSASGASGTEPR